MNISRILNISNKLFIQGLQTAVLLTIFFSVSTSAAGPEVILTKPEMDASLNNTNVKFEFIPKSDSTMPLNCELYVDNVKIGEVTAVSGFPTVVSAILERGSHSWFVSCMNENTEKGKSESRKLDVSSFKQQTTVETIEKKTGAILTGFSVSGAIIAGEAKYLESWHSVVGDHISFSANVSNTGENNFTATLIVKIKNFRTEEFVAVTSSKPVYVAAGESVKLNADWIPLKEGEYYAEGAVSDENEKVFQRSFIKIVVSPRSVAGKTAVVVAILSVIVIAIASYATQKNIKKIKNA